ncbi:elongation factor 4 [Candidatus Dojkabacteria bacterium]|nr:elongation factor 4 [Candidatus Dojkabacteria bacterium]
MQNTRNFSIIAHIDHGKSTLSDRFLELTGLKDPSRDKSERVLDRLDLEQEKGITIKLQPVRMNYNGHILNLIDTPGHVDFSYEVSRSLAACEGAILLVDASQGVQAQTLSTTRKAKEMGLKIIPVLNKIDIPNIDIDKRKREFSEIIGFNEDEIILASGKTGEGAKEILDRIINDIPAPEGYSEAPLQALIFDSFYHEHKGVIAAVRIFNGQISATQSQKLHLLKNGNNFSPREIGFFEPDLEVTKEISAGEVGYIATGVKDIRLFAIGDTISDSPKTKPLPGYNPPRPRVFATLFPSDPDDFHILSDSLTKLSMNDAALTVTQQKSNILGSGFRCGFLGMLHMEVIQERLEREYDMSLVITAPSVEYKVKLTNGETLNVQTASEFPEVTQIQEIKEPWVDVEIFTPQEHMGPLMELCQNSRGIYKDTEYLSRSENFKMDYILLKYELPLMSIITNFFDNMKSLSSGYASLEYTESGYKPADIVKVSILVNYDEVPSLSFLETRDRAENRARKVLESLKKTIPQHQFKIAIQGAIGGKVIARENISARKKDVTAKLYGGDVTRKKKLWKKQKEGKKRLREIGGVNIPQEAFLSVLQS